MSDTSWVECPECGSDATLYQGDYNGLPDVDMHCEECGYTWSCVEGRLEPDELAEMREESQQREAPERNRTMSTIREDRRPGKAVEISWTLTRSLEGTLQAVPGSEYDSLTVAKMVAEGNALLEEDKKGRWRVYKVDPATNRIITHQPIAWVGVDDVYEEDATLHEIGKEVEDG